MKRHDAFAGLGVLTIAYRPIMYAQVEPGLQGEGCSEEEDVSESEDEDEDEDTDSGSGGEDVRNGMPQRTLREDLGTAWCDEAAFTFNEDEPEFVPIVETNVLAVDSRGGGPIPSSRVEADESEGAPHDHNRDYWFLEGRHYWEPEEQEQQQTQQLHQQGLYDFDRPRRAIGQFLSFG